MGESAMVNTSDVGSLVEFTFDVSHRHHSEIAHCIYNMRAAHPRFRHPRPVFEGNASEV